MYSDDSNGSSEYIEPKKASKSQRHRKNKRRKTEYQEEELYSEPTEPHISFESLLDQLEDLSDDELLELEDSFDDLICEDLPEYIQTRTNLMSKDAERDDAGVLLRRLTRAEITSAVDISSAKSGPLSIPEAIAIRKLKLERERRRASLRSTNISTSADGVVEGIVESTSTQSNPEVLDALACIRKTSYDSSFASRLHGSYAHPSGLIYVDWDTKTPWMNLMEDIREHHQLMHPDCDPVTEPRATIMYTSLQTSHLNQVHDILNRFFWQGIDVSDSLEYSPEKCTVVASYNKLVVGVAIMSSPRETYITYLAVRHGWDSSNIATTMLYHLITSNPSKDITLHVSANNPAMLLYNRFGFKSEEFIAGFYEAYLDPESRASKNAVRLRLRHH